MLTSNLWAFDICCQTISYILAYLTDCFTSHLNFTYIWIKYCAVGVNPVTGVASATILTRRSSQLRVIPNSNHQYIAHTNAIFITTK
ncbi:Uncharacterised protein [Klebsiella variicola]|uniref:Uncharacterized protein n=1 Tax=Klebsiella variicola TaxID=244366 RepID=A0A7H4MNN7_KLEVA|nr:Uncharacterised protein [Klebsiella variicola]